MADTKGKKIVVVRLTPSEQSEIEQICETLECEPSILIRMWTAQSVSARVQLGRASLPSVSPENKALQILVSPTLHAALPGRKPHEAVYWVIQKMLSAYRSKHLPPALPFIATAQQVAA